jgi:hypothetical protein
MLLICNVLGGLGLDMRFVGRKREKNIAEAEKPTE